MRLAMNQEAARLSDVARLANELQMVGATRTEALLQADRLQARYGWGLTLGAIEARAFYGRILRTAQIDMHYRARAINCARQLTDRSLLDAGYCLDAP